MIDHSHERRGRESNEKVRGRDEGRPGVQRTTRVTQASQEGGQIIGS